MLREKVYICAHIFFVACRLTLYIWQVRVDQFAWEQDEGMVVCATVKETYSLCSYTAIKLFQPHSTTNFA